MKKVLTYLFDFLIVLIVVFAVAITFISLNTDENGISKLNGYIPLNIQTDSMVPTIKVGDMIITKEVDVDDLKVDDIISFLAEEEDTTIIKTHRIIDIKNENEVITYTTKGDNNEVADEVPVTEGNVVSLYKGVRIPLLGGIMTFLQSRVGFFIFIILPLFILFIYQLYKFIITIVDEKKKDLVESIRKEEAEKNKSEE